MLPIRRFVACAAAAGAVMLPFTFTAAQPAAAYCEDRLIEDGSTGCSNSCQDTGELIAKVSSKLGNDWNCPQ